jgi:hypothetical protein
MPDEVTTLVLKSLPGIKRDGTKYEGDAYVDGQWVRFQRGLPRKIGGYRSTQKKLPEISRGFTTFTQRNNNYCFSGGASYLSQFTIDNSYNSSPVVDRAPVSYVADEANMWMFDFMYNSSSTENCVIAHSAPNLDSVTNSTGGQIFYGPVTESSDLTGISIPSGANCTGGIVVLHPYLFYYGSDGVIGWSKPGEPGDLTSTADGAGLARVWGQKIIKGMPLRATGGPAGIFWAWDAVIRATFAGGDTVFQFDVVSSESSILSPNSVVEYDGVFFWAGVDRFLMYNGVVREVPNAMNINWFFDGLNRKQKSKVFAFKVPRYGEIWWCYPRGAAEECSHAVIFNVRDNCWYDTELPGGGRSAGRLNNAFSAPLLTGVNGTTDDFRVWLHEIGADEIDGSNINPVVSYFETSDISTLVQGRSEFVRVSKIEPDFVQTGPMTVQIVGRSNARSSEVYSTEFAFPEAPTDYREQIVLLKEQRRELRVKFKSNAVNGDFQMGQIILHVQSGDQTTVS